MDSSMRPRLAPPHALARAPDAVAPVREDRVASAAARDLVALPVARADDVGAAAAADPVATRARDDPVRARAAAEPVGSALPVEPVVAAVAVHAVVAGPAEQLIVPERATGRDAVLPDARGTGSLPRDDVVARSGLHAVGAAEPDHRVVAAQRRDHVVVGGTEQRVVPARPDDLGAERQTGVAEERRNENSQQPLHRGE